MPSDKTEVDDDDLTESILGLNPAVLAGWISEMDLSVAGKAGSKQQSEKQKFVQLASFNKNRHGSDFHLTF